MLRQQHWIRDGHPAQPGRKPAAHVCFDVSQLESAALWSPTQRFTLSDREVECLNRQQRWIGGGHPARHGPPTGAAAVAEDAPLVPGDRGFGRCRQRLPSEERTKGAPPPLGYQCPLRVWSCLQTVGIFCLVRPTLSVTQQSLNFACTVQFLTLVLQQWQGRYVGKLARSLTNACLSWSPKEYFGMCMC
jgi:hypothetical protein